MKLTSADIDMEILGDNPEAIFDFLTIQSLKDRFNHTAVPRAPKKGKSNENEAIYQNDAEFETYVQQFPIDDSIAECFAKAADTDSTQQSTKFVSGGKRPQMSSKYNKLKKKFGWKQSADESTPTDDDFVSRDSKRSKKGGVFSKRHKWRGLGGTKKALQFSDQSTSPITNDVKDGIPSRALDLSPNDTNSVSDSQITSYSETLTPDDQTVPLMKGDNPRYNEKQYKSSLQGIDNYGALMVDDVSNCFESIFNGDSTCIIQNLEDIQPDEAGKLRDSNGNTLLHYAVLIGNPDAVKFILEKYPDMTSDMNRDNATAVEVAAKNGKFDCLKVILERNQRRNTLGPSLVNRLLNISAQNGQSECLNLLLPYLSRDPQISCSLPGDNRGNTAAHLAAKSGHLHCLQILLAAGYDVTSENLMRQRPLHIAHQNRNETCFSYLLLLDVCEELVRLIKGQIQPSSSHNDVISGRHDNHEHVNNILHRYHNLLRDTRQSLDESRDNILQTLEKLQNDLDLFIKHTDCDTAYKRKVARDRLDEFQSERERLEDIFEFSQIVEMEATVTKLLEEVGSTVKPETERVQNSNKSTPNMELSMSEEDFGHILCLLVKDIYKEFMLENWNVGHVFEKHLGTSTSNRGSDVKYNTSAELDSSAERLAAMTPTYHNLAEKSSSSNLNVENRSSQTEFDEPTCKVCQNISARQSYWEKVLNGADRIDNDIENEDHEVKDLIDSDKTQEINVSPLSNDETLYGEEWDKNPFSHTQVEAQSLQPTERPFAKLLTLDERMDLLISGQRSKVKHSDSSDTLVEKTGSPEEPESMYTTTFTSVTSDSTSGLSEWYSKLGFSSLDTSPDDVTHEVSSETPSYWWDTGDDREKGKSGNFRKPDTFREDVRRQIHLNLENEDSSFEELRRNRLLSHLQSVQQTRFPSENYAERITTASGEVIGGFPSRDDTTKIVVDVNGVLRRRGEPNPDAGREHFDSQKLFTLEDAINSNRLRPSEFYGRYNVRSRDVFESPPDRWEDMTNTDDDDSRLTPWYEMDDISQVIRWKTDTETSDGRVTPQSYV